MTTIEEFVRLGAEEKAKVTRALEGMAGLPVFGGLEELDHALAALWRIVEGYALDAEAVAGAWEASVEVPFAVSAENIAALALVVEQMRFHAKPFKEFTDRIADKLLDVDEVRRRQEAADAG